MVHEVANVAARASFVEAHSSWAADPVHLPHIRSQTRNWLAPLALDQDTEQDLVLAVNEAVSNAIEHAYVAPGPGDLVTVSYGPDRAIRTSKWLTTAGGDGRTPTPATAAVAY